MVETAGYRGGIFMAITPFKKVTSREVYGADISGLQDAVNKMESILDMQTSTATDHVLQAVADQAEPALHRRLYEGTIRNWLESPAPVIKRNAVVVAAAEYVLYAAQGMVVFNAQQATDAVITANFAYVIADSLLLGHAGAGGGAHAAATLEAAGFMSAEDKMRFNAIDYLRYRRAGLYHAGINALGPAALSTASGVVDVSPFYVPSTQTFDRIAINVTTLAAGNTRLGLYADNGTVYPGVRLLDAGIVTTGTTGIRWLSVNLALPAGLYWLARLQDATPSLQGIAGHGLIALGTDDLSAIVTGFRVTRAYGDGLPDPFPSGAAFLTGSRPMVFLRGG
ncbi:MAG: hypothetical protein Q8N36_06255 [bacterium]|nr:hypothetical protein [bacterium]